MTIAEIRAKLNYWWDARGDHTQPGQEEADILSLANIISDILSYLADTPEGSA